MAFSINRFEVQYDSLSGQIVRQLVASRDSLEHRGRTKFLHLTTVLGLDEVYYIITLSGMNLEEVRYPTLNEALIAFNDL